MMNYIKYCVLFFLPLAFFSCGDAFETTLEIDPPQHEEKLVVYAFGNTRTNLLVVSVAKSVGLLENVDKKELYINNAKVVLHRGEESYLLDFKEPDFNWGEEQFYNYFLPEGTIVLEKGETYTIEVEADGYPMASATTIVPNDINPTEITFDDNEISFDGGTYVSIDVVFDDPSGQNDFYETSVLVSSEIFGGAEGFDMIYTEFIDPIIEYGWVNLIFKDGSFNGNRKKIQLLIDDYYTEVINGENALDYLYLNWRIISEDHYRYSKSVQQQRDAQGNPFASPIQVYSNIDNGLGVFTIVNEQFLKVN